MEYTTLSIQDKIDIARSTLRGLEADHFRLSLDNREYAAPRIAELEQQIENLSTSLGLLEVQAPPAEEPADLDPIEDPGSDEGQEEARKRSKG